MDRIIEWTKTEESKMLFIASKQILFKCIYLSVVSYISSFRCMSLYVQFCRVFVRVFFSVGAYERVLCTKRGVEMT